MTFRVVEIDGIIPDNGLFPVMAHPSNLPTDFSALVTDFLKDSGSSDDLAVDGSTTPVVFTYEADETDDIAVFRVRIFASVTGLKFGGYFFSLDTLTNGLLIELVHDNGTTATIGNVKETEEFYMLSALTGITHSADWNRDIILVDLNFCGLPLLKAGTSDEMRITVRDDLDAVSIFYFKAKFCGMKVV